MTRPARAIDDVAEFTNARPSFKFSVATGTAPAASITCKRCQWYAEGAYPVDVFTLADTHECGRRRGEA